MCFGKFLTIQIFSLHKLGSARCIVLLWILHFCFPQQCYSAGFCETSRHVATCEKERPENCHLSEIPVYLSWTGKGPVLGCTSCRVTGDIKQWQIVGSVNSSLWLLYLRKHIVFWQSAWLLTMKIVTMKSKAVFLIY